METSASLSESGELNIWTRSWTHNFLQGSHSRVVVYLLGENDHHWGKTDALACGVGGIGETLLPIFDKSVKSDRSEQYKFHIPADFVSQVKYLKIVHFSKNKDFAEYVRILHRLLSDDKHPTHVTNNYTGIGHMEGCRLGDNVKVGGVIYEARGIQLTQIPTENKTMTPNPKNDTRSGDTINQSSNFGIGHMNGGKIEAGAKVAGVINEAEQQNLTEAAAQIQQLLEQLEKSYPTNTTAGKMAIATEAILQIDSNPTLADRILSALKAGGISAFEQVLNHPAASFVIGALEDWKESKGS
ncbi:hypothetical protein [Microseira wollei]|nr:hypothetical protein [Microseira wollei]